MKMICLDLEGVLVPEIWIAFAEETGIPEFRKTTRDEPDYNKLMRFRIDLLKKHNLKLPDIQRVIGALRPLDGAVEFVRAVRERAQLIILSDTYQEFAGPLMAKLEYPTIFCNNLIVSEAGDITGFRIRQENGKKYAVAALKLLNMRVFASGDSFNDIAMIQEADAGCLFRPPESIKKRYAEIPRAESYEDLLSRIASFLT
jgi:phosphoserine/homoserine phosphotransferase